MASRVGVFAILLAACGIAVTSAAARQPPAGTAMYVVHQDRRLCPSPLCGGYWVAIANGSRTRCSDGLRRVSCYAGRAIDSRGGAIGGGAEGALARGAIEKWRDDFGGLDQLVLAAVYAPAGRAAPSGGFYRVVDTGIRCVRAPCFSFRATQVNGSTRTTMSSLDLAASEASAGELALAEASLRSKNGLYARGRFARTADGGTVFRALRLYLRAPLPRA